MTSATWAACSPRAAGLDEVQHGRPAHEAVKCRVALVEHRPERAECVVVPSLAREPPRHGRGARGRAAARPSSPSALARVPGASHRGRLSLPRSAAASAPTSCPVSPNCGWRVSRARIAASAPAALGRFPVARVGGSPCVVDERLREHAEPALLAQPLDRAREEPRAAAKSPAFSAAMPDVHCRDRIGYLLQPQACRLGAAPTRAVNSGLASAIDGQQSWVVVR